MVGHATNQPKHKERTPKTSVSSYQPSSPFRRDSVPFTLPRDTADPVETTAE
jgi:hypothetical protein